MVIEPSKSSTGKVYYYYNCRNYKHIGKEVCKGRRVRADKLDDFLIDVICKDLFSEKNIANMIKIMNNMLENRQRTALEKNKKIKRKIRDVERRLQALYDAIEGGYVDLEDIGDRIKQLKKTKEELTRELEENPQGGEFKRVEVTPRLIQKFREDILSLIKHSSKKSLRSFFSEFIDKIVLNPKTVTIHYNSRILSRRAFPEKSAQLGTVWLPYLKAYTKCFSSVFELIKTRKRNGRYSIFIGKLINE